MSDLQPNTHIHNINFKIICNPPRSPRIHKTNHKSNLQSPGQSQHTQNEFRHKCQLPSPYPSYNNNFQNQIKSFSELAKLCLVVTDEKGLASQQPASSKPASQPAASQSASQQPANYTKHRALSCTQLLKHRLDDSL